MNVRGNGARFEDRKEEFGMCLDDNLVAHEIERLFSRSPLPTDFGFPLLRVDVGGLFYFSDPNWTNYPARNYRIRSP